MAATDKQVRRLMKLIQKEKTLAAAAAKADMDEKTARKYRDIGKLPSEIYEPHTWRTREDPFEEVWEEIREMIDANSGFEAKTLFGYLQRKYPGKFADGQLRTLQRRIKAWRALEGPPREVFFPQVYYPGRLCLSDFTHMTSLGITIQGQLFRHLVYHFVLPYSNWETGYICFSECFEALSEGFQKALWELGGVPEAHRTDRLTTAVNNMDNPKEFTRRYDALLKHYRLAGRKIQASKPHENGDVEKSHDLFKNSIRQSLLLRGSNDFSSIEEYKKFLQTNFKQLNAGRRKRFLEELRVLRRLPDKKLDSLKKETPRVGPSSTIRVQHNVYSVHSRLIGEKVEARIYADHIDLWYAQRRVETLPRLRGSGKHKINYRHIIDWLVRKPGAFENYRYHDDLFPTTRFRVAYDSLKNTNPLHASKEYLRILYLAARETETGVDEALRVLIDQGGEITSKKVETIVQSGQKIRSVRDVEVSQIDLATYDALLKGREVA